MGVISLALPTFLLALCHFSSAWFQEDNVCGGRVINLERFFCCGDKPYLIEENKKCCAGVVMDRQFYGCTLSMTGYVKFPNLCQGEMFNRDTHFCCRDVLYSHTSGKECCDTRIMDKSFYKCRYMIYGYLPYPLPPYDCFTKFYNPDSQLCCDRFRILEKDSGEQC